MVHVYVEMGGGCRTYIIFIIMNKLQHWTKLDGGGVWRSPKNMWGLETSPVEK